MLYARDPNFILLISCLHELTIMEQSFDIVDVVNSCVGSFQLIYILTQNCKYSFLIFWGELLKGLLLLIYNFKNKISVDVSLKMCHKKAADEAFR